jgi:hypothetical protein
MILTDAHHRLFGEYLHWIAHKEMALGEIRPDLWARAVAESMGDAARARGIYRDRRAQSLREEASVAQEFLRLLQQNEDGAANVRDAVVFSIARAAGCRAESPG